MTLAGRETAPSTAPSRGSDELEQIEIELLLEAVFRRYGFDFREYATPSLHRRLQRRIRAEGLATVSGLTERILHDPSALQALVQDLSINVTAMFRDPGFFLAFRKQVVPLLRTYAFTRIWHAGCSTGEEVLSTAIVLEEEGVLSRTRIYATDIDEAALSRARAGVVPIAKISEYARSYSLAGGRRALSDYYLPQGSEAAFRPALLESVVFARHNLVCDRSFNEFNVIVCRNVLIYFGKLLQDRVHELFYDSLSTLGVLALGPRESPRLTPRAPCYADLHAVHRLYRKMK